VSVVAVLVLLVLFFLATGSQNILSLIDPKIVKFAEAIKEEENSDPKYNNPGDLKLGDKGYGVFGEAPGITIFGTETEGWQALYHELELVQLGIARYLKGTMTWIEFGKEYSGDNSWGPNVAAKLGVDPNSTVGEYFSGRSIGA
jgi:hypothetical protein